MSKVEQDNMKLNLGCMNDYREGWINLDFDRNYKADIYHNLNIIPYPFKENQFDEILASAILEHLDNPLDVMMEFWRIGKDNGRIYLLLPHCSALFHWAEIEHKHAFTVNSFGRWEWNKELYPYFEVEKRRLSFTVFNYRFLNHIINPLINLFPVVYERLFSGILPCSVIIYILRINKDENKIKEKTEYLKQMEDESRKTFDTLRFIKNI